MVALAIFVVVIFNDNYQNVLVSDYFAKDSCSKNQKELMQNIMMYATEHESVMPGAEIWTVLEIEPNVIKCVEDKRVNVENSYAYNANLFSLNLKDIIAPAALIATADSDAENNFIRTFSDLNFRHIYKKTRENFAIISYIDGHVGAVAPDDMSFIKFENKADK